MTEPGAGLAQRAVAKGSATVLQAGRDVVSGNVFVGRFARLRDVWLDPTPVFDEVEVDQFVGRKWLVDAIERFMRTRDRGYVVVQATAGLGKTAFAAWLAKRYSWPCHFTRRRKGRLSPVALRNLAAQLIARYDLADQFSPAGMLPDTAGEPGWFDHVLRTARAAAAGERIVLVVDGLDEAEQIDGDLPLGLPSSLPSGVFVILTCRIGTDLSALRQPWTALTIHADDRRNTDDLRRYLETCAQDEPIASVLAEHQLPTREFTQQLVNRCGGVWVYLRYVLHELRLGLRTIDDLHTLPADLANYYLESLGPTAEPENWARVRLPVLATLAAIAEPIPLPMLTRLAGSHDEGAVAMFCHGRLRPFLSPIFDNHGQPLYGIYHASLRELVSTRSAEHDLDGIQATTRQLAAATTQAHNRIANQYLTAFGELDSNLPALAANTALATADAHYPRRHLAFHLEHAGRIDDLHRLLAIERTKDRHSISNLWFDVHDSTGQLGDYLDDIRRARLHTEQESNTQIQTGCKPTSLGLELHYALIVATVTALTANVPAPLVVRLVDTKLWTVTRGIEHARNLHDPGTRAEALIGLSTSLPQDHQLAVATEALAAAQATVYDRYRFWLLRKLRLCFAPTQRKLIDQQILAAAMAIDDPNRRALALFELAVEQPESEQRRTILDTALRAVNDITDENTRTDVLVEVAEQVPDAFVALILRAATEVRDERNTARMLVAIADRLTTDQLPDALFSARMIQHDTGSRSWAVGRLAKRADSDNTELIDEATTAAYATDDLSSRTWALAQLCDLVDEDMRQTILADALTAANQIEPNTYDRASALATLMPKLTGEEHTATLNEALRAARAIADDRARCRVLQTIASTLDESKREPVLTEILTTLSQLDGDTIVEIIVDLIPILPSTLFMDVLIIARTLSNSDQRSWLLDRLAGSLPAELIGEALTVSQTISHDFGRAQLFGEVLARSSAHDVTLATKALTAAKNISSPYFRTLALIELADRLPDDREALLSDALAAASTANGFDRADLIAALAAKCDAGQLDGPLREALAEAQEIRDPYHRAMAIACLVPYTTGPDLERVRTELMESAHASTPTYFRGLLLWQLAPLIPTAQTQMLSAGLEVLRRLSPDDGPVAKLLRKLARIATHLPRKLLLDVAELITASIIKDDVGRTPIAAKLARYLRLVPNRLITEAITVLPTLPGVFNITPILGPLAMHLPPPLREQALNEALTTARRTRVARRGAILQAAALRSGRPTLDDIALLRRCLDTLDLNDTLSVLAAAIPTIHDATDHDTLLGIVHSVHTIERWWYPTSGDESHSTRPPTRIAT
jgi:hypothetical protein